MYLYPQTPPPPPPPPRYGYIPGPDISPPLVVLFLNSFYDDILKLNCHHMYVSASLGAPSPWYRTPPRYADIPFQSGSSYNRPSRTHDLSNYLLSTLPYEPVRSLKLINLTLRITDGLWGNIPQTDNCV